MDTYSSQQFTHALSVNVYGRGDASKGDGPSHVGLAIHELGSNMCQMHHVRCPDDEHYVYDPRFQPLNDAVLWGRCEIQKLTESNKNRSVVILTAFGMDSQNLPEMGIANCQDWLAGAVDALENERLCAVGEGSFWKSQINCSANEMMQHCKKTDRRWIESENQIIDPATIDARFTDVEKQSVGKLQENSKFKDAFAMLGASIGARSNATSSPVRPFYVSSPFFSKTSSEDAN